MTGKIMQLVYKKLAKRKDTIDEQIEQEIAQKRFHDYVDALWRIYSSVRILRENEFTLSEDELSVLEQAGKIAYDKYKVELGRLLDELE